MYNLANPLHVDSIQILSHMFPRITDTWNTTGINWSGKRSGPPIDLGDLQGDKCLVFFLGGIPDNFSGSPSPNCTGFSTNPTNPAAHIPSGGDTLPPFFEFDSSRLVPSNGFYSYLDSYRQRPYAYFSSGKSRNDYNRYFGTYHNSDCASLLVIPNSPLGGSVWP